MITVPRMKLKKLDVAKLYNALSIADTTPLNYPTNYYLLTREQKDFVEALFRVAEDSFKESLEEHEEDVLSFEEDLAETIRELKNDN